MREKHRLKVAVRQRALGLDEARLDARLVGGVMDLVGVGANQLRVFEQDVTFVGAAQIGREVGEDFQQANADFGIVGAVDVDLVERCVRQLLEGKRARDDAQNASLIEAKRFGQIARDGFA